MVSSSSREDTETHPSVAETADEDESLEGVGVLLESHQQSKTEYFTWPSDNHLVQVLLKVVENEPATHLSGHSRSPAAKELCDYISDHWKEMNPPVTLLELGAGNALPSLACLQFFCRSLSMIFVTDHDHTCLERARCNHESTVECLLDSSLNEEEIFDAINLMGSIPVEFIEYKWGDPTLPGIIHDRFIEHAISASNVDLVVATDTLHGKNDVAPLLRSVAAILQPGTGLFLLASSKEWDSELQHEIDRVSEALNLSKTVRREQNGARIVEFRSGEMVRLETQGETVPCVDAQQVQD